MEQQLGKEEYYKWMKRELEKIAQLDAELSALLRAESADRLARARMRGVCRATRYGVLVCDSLEERIVHFVLGIKKSPLNKGEAERSS